AQAGHRLFTQVAAPAADRGFATSLALKVSTHSHVSGERGGVSPLLGRNRGLTPFRSPNSGGIMAKSTLMKPKSSEVPSNGTFFRQPAEVEYATELAALRAADKDERPDGWNLSPRAVRTYVLGGKGGDVEVRPKYLGSERVVEIAIATL